MPADPAAVFQRQATAASNDLGARIRSAKRPFPTTPSGDGLTQHIFLEEEHMSFSPRPGNDPRRRWVFGVGSAVVLLAMAFFISSALGVVSGSPSNFESGDGDMLAQS